MSDRTEGVLFNREDGVFFVPEDQLGQFRIPDAEAEKLRSNVEGDEVSGFASKGVQTFRTESLRPSVKPISWGFDGPIVLRGTYSLNPTAG